MVVATSSLQHGGKGGFRPLGLLIICFLLPYLFGVLVSRNKIDDMREIFGPILDRFIPTVHENLGRFLYKRQQLEQVPQQNLEKQPESDGGEKCYEAFLNILQSSGSSKNPFENLNIELHRNGESEVCGVITNIHHEFKSFFSESWNESECTESHILFETKYSFESLLTQVLHRSFQNTASCNSKEDDQTNDSGFNGFCDMGESRTPILSDHTRLVRITSQSGNQVVEYLPCHFHDEYGVRVSSLSQMAELANRVANTKYPECTIDMNGESDNHCNLKSIQFYAVPAGRVFIHASSYVGQIIQLPHVTGGDPNEPVYMRVISLEPKVFDIINFFSMEESEDLVQRALAETSESHRIKRSSTGATGYNLNERRTSESGYDTSGKTSVAIKKYVGLRIELILFCTCFRNYSPHSNCSIRL
jgi:hypothetical protein